jgi:Tfp pilus assembly protein PilN
VSAARNDLATATAQNDKLVKTLATYNDVKTTAAQLNASEATLTQAMSTEVRWSEYFADFGFLPANTWLTKLTLTNALPAGSLLSPSQAPQQIGSVAVEGYAMKYGDLANWLDALEPEQGVSNVDFTKAAEQYIGTTKVVQFAGTAGLTSAALSGRCAKAGSC